MFSLVKMCHSIEGNGPTRGRVVSAAFQASTVCEQCALWTGVISERLGSEILVLFSPGCYQFCFKKRNVLGLYTRGSLPQPYNLVVTLNRIKTGVRNFPSGFFELQSMSKFLATLVIKCLCMASDFFNC